MELYIKSLKIDEKKFTFNSKSTIIQSNKNSVGKTSLLRIILFSLGYPIPSTKGLNFKKMALKVIFSRNNVDYEISREDFSVTIKNLKNKSSRELNTNTDKLEILNAVYGYEEPGLLENVLALHYFDQEKGWTLLNRGKVVGGISFSIERLIEGLSTTELARLNEQLTHLLKEQRTYKQFKTLLEIRSDFESNVDDTSWSSVDELHDEIRSIDIEIRRARGEVQQYKRVKSDNNKIIELIENMGLRIKDTSGRTQLVRRDDIVGFDVNQDLVNAQIVRQIKRIDNLSAEKAVLIRKLNSKVSLIDVDTRLARFNGAISKLDVSVENINAILNDYRSEISKIRHKIKGILNSTKIVNGLYERVLEYTKKLGVDDAIDPYADFIFTSNLKRYSGANLHLLVFAFRLALLKEVQNEFDESVPIIMDSPMSGELDRENTKKMFALLSEEFKNNQIIVATIFDLSDEFKWDKAIKLNNKLLD